MKSEWHFKVVPCWTKMAWLLHQLAFRCGLPREGVSLCKEALSRWENPWRLAVKCCVLTMLPAAAQVFHWRRFWPCIQWGMWLSAILDSHSYFHLRKRMIFLELWQVPGKDSCLPWNSYSLGQYFDQEVKYYDGHIIHHAHPCEQPVSSRGMGLAVPQNPIQSGKSISPREGVVVL